MIRLGIFLLGVGMVFIGVANNSQRIPTFIDCKSITCSLGFVTVSLDVILMVVGVFFILVAWVFHKLNASN